MSQTRCTPPDLKAAAASAAASNLPVKSKASYEKARQEFLAWCKKSKVPSGYVSANVLVAYFDDLKKTKAPTTMWSTYSKLKKTLLALDGVNIEDKAFRMLKAQLKSYGVDYEPKKSKLFSLDEVYRFCREAPDEEYLAIKAISLIGIIGALRHGELYNLTLAHIVDRGHELFVTIADTKPHRAKTFIVQQNPDTAVDPVTIYRRYLALRPDGERLNKARAVIADAVWLRYERGKCTAQRIGKKSIAEYPKRIATFLKLPTPEAYTGHAFRRTGATSAVNNGADLLQLKALGDWKSDSVAQGYLEDSEPAKRKRAALVQGLPAAKELRVDIPASASHPVFNITGCASVQIHYITPAPAPCIAPPQAAQVQAPEAPK